MHLHQFIENFNRTLDELDADRIKRHPVIMFDYLGYFDYIGAKTVSTPKEENEEAYAKTWPFAGMAGQLQAAELNRPMNDKEKLEYERDTAVADCHKMELNREWWRGFVCGMLWLVTYTVVHAVWEGVKLGMHWTTDK